MCALRSVVGRARPAKPRCARPANGGDLARADDRAADRARWGRGRVPWHGWRAQAVEPPAACSALAGRPLAHQTLAHQTLANLALALPVPARMAARLASPATALVRRRAARSR